MSDCAIKNYDVFKEYIYEEYDKYDLNVSESDIHREWLRYHISDLTEPNQKVINYLLSKYPDGLAPVNISEDSVEIMRILSVEVSKDSVKVIGDVSNINGTTERVYTFKNGSKRSEPTANIKNGVVIAAMDNIRNNAEPGAENILGVSESDNIQYSAEPTSAKQWFRRFDNMTDEEQQSLNKFKTTDDARESFRIAMDEAIVGELDLEGNRVNYQPLPEHLWAENEVTPEGVDKYEDQLLANIELIDLIAQGLSAEGKEIDLTHHFEIYDVPGLEFSSARINHNTKKIQLFRSTNKSNISNDGELMAHELNHAVTELGIQFDIAHGQGKLTKKLQQLQSDVMRKIDAANDGEGWRILLEDIEEPLDVEIDRAKDLWTKYIDASPSEFLAYARSNKALMNTIGALKGHVEVFKYFDVDPSGSKGVNIIKKVFNHIFSMINMHLAAKNHSVVDANGDLIVNISAVLNSYYEKFMRISMEGKYNAEHGIKDAPMYITERTYESYGWTNKFFKAADKVNKMNTSLIAIHEKIEEKLGKMGEKGKIIGAKLSPFVDKFLDIKGMRWIAESRTWSDFIGTMLIDTTSKANAWKYEEFRQNKSLSDKAQVHHKNEAAKAIKKIVENLNDEENKSLTAMLRTGWDGTGLSLDEYSKIVKDEEKLVSEIEKLNKEVGIKASFVLRDFGYWLAKKEAKSQVVVKNVESAITTVYSRKEIGALEADKNLDSKRKAFDKLSSLYAIYYMSQSDKDSIVSAIETDKDAVQQVMNLHKVYSDKQDNVIGAKGFTDKGYLYRRSLSPIMFDVVPESEFNDKDEFMGYKKVKKMDMVNEFTGSTEAMWLIVRNNYSSSRTQGVIDDISLIDSKTTIDKLFGNKDKFNFEKRDILKNRAMKKGYKNFYNEINAHIKSGKKSIDFSREFMAEKKSSMVMTPNEKGYIDSVSIELNESDLVNYMNIEQRIEDTLSSTMSHISNKELAVRNNIKFIDKAMIDSENNKNEKGYVRLAPDVYDAEGNILNTDNKYGKEWGMLPKYIRKRIKDNIGNEIWVDRSFLTNMLGYSDPTIANAKIGSYSLYDYPKVQEALRKMEYYWKYIVKTSKGIIVKFFPEVVLGNATSNMFVALRHGVQPVEYADAFIEGWTDLNAHQEIQAEITRFELLRDSGVENLDFKINELYKQLSNNSMDSLVRDGQFSNIIEDLDFDVTQSSTHADEIVKKYLGKMGKRISPEKLEAIRKALYITQDTPVAKVVEKITAYNDIINRKIIQDKMMYELDQSVKRGEIKNTKLYNEKVRWINNYLDVLFVNYSYLDPKFIKWLNDVSVFRFTKFMMRSARAVLNSIRYNPAGYLLFEGFDSAVQATIGVNIEDPMEQYKDFVNKASGKVFQQDPFEMFYNMVVPRPIVMVSS